MAFFKGLIVFSFVFEWMENIYKCYIYATNHSGNVIGRLYSDFTILAACVSVARRFQNFLDKLCPNNGVQCNFISICQRGEQFMSTSSWVETNWIHNWSRNQQKFTCLNSNSVSNHVIELHTGASTSLHVRRGDEEKSRAALLVNPCWYALNEASTLLVNTNQHVWRVMRRRYCFSLLLFF